MAHFDLPLEKLKDYRSPDPEPADFDYFWQQTFSESAAFPIDVHFDELPDPVFRQVVVYDVTFAGFMGQPVKGWLLLPRGESGKLPCLVRFLGYGGGRGLPTEYLAAPVAGFALFVMDTRGQGSVWSPGDTPDNYGTGPQFPGFLTRGIESRDRYYYRRLFVDAARAVEAAGAHDLVDRTRIGTMGNSQGGALAIVAAALCGERVKLLMSDVPFLCNFRRATTLIDGMPYAEIAGYIKCRRDADAVFEVLDYFDCVNLARRVKARTLFSVGLMDTVCPPSTIYAAYNEIPASKEIRTYAFNSHEGGGIMHEMERLRFAQKYL